MSSFPGASFTDDEDDSEETTLNSFHVHLYARRPTNNGSQAFEFSFDDAVERLKRFPRLLLEPDGSFVWAGNGFQIFGMLYDAENQIQYVELRGKCRLVEFRHLVCNLFEIASTDWSNSSIVVMALPERQWQDLQSVERLSDH